MMNGDRDGAEKQDVLRSEEFWKMEVYFSLFGEGALSLRVRIQCFDGFEFGIKLSLSSCRHTVQSIPNLVSWFFHWSKLLKCKHYKIQNKTCEDFWFYHRNNDNETFLLCNSFLQILSRHDCNKAVPPFDKFLRIPSLLAFYQHAHTLKHQKLLVLSLPSATISMYTLYES